MSNELMRREIKEAIRAGERALRSLQEAQGKLNSAKNWGFVDMFGGGFITSLFKHGTIQEASQCVERAKSDLNILQRELTDVHILMDFRVEIGQFLTFADFFFDGIIVDYFTQEKINDARTQVDDAIYQVEKILTRLRNLETTQW